MLLLRRQCGSGTIWRKKRFLRLGISLPGRNGYQFPLRVAQRSQLSPEDAAGINIDRTVQPFRFRHRRVAIDHHGRAAIFRRPIISHWQAKFIGFAGRFAEQRKIAHRPGTTALHGLLHARVGNHQLAVVQDVVADQLVDEFRGDAAEPAVISLVSFKLLQ